ncbi:hypothetical protein [Paraburkholderia sp. GAS82]|uniref:hypothetical protein n=1 Tax=Paraburkholderia sp. GAS82 TaxID=3035137 RepID=UPI003D21205D
MMKRALRVVSGSVLSVSQKSIITDGFSTNGAPVKFDSEGIALRLDLVQMPLTVNTTRASDIFIAAGDKLDVACFEEPDRLQIYGIRNNTDGSVYLARTAQVASARWEVASVPLLLGASLIMAAIGHFFGLDRDFLLKGVLLFGVLPPAVICTIGAVARLFGHAAMPEIRGHAQPGGRHEMIAARQALAITQEERRYVRFI